MENLQVNEDGKYYFLEVDGLHPRIEYIKTKEKIYLTHTEVPTKLEGRGVGKKMVKVVLDDIREKDLTLIPLCPFVATFIKKTPEYRDLVIKQ